MVINKYNNNIPTILLNINAIANIGAKTIDTMIN